MAGPPLVPHRGGPAGGGLGDRRGPHRGAGSPRPIFAYAHGTTGLGDQCALSAQIANGTAVELSVLPVLVSQGLTVVIPDYQGLGTPGDHPYLVGQSEGRNLLDGIRAAGLLEGTGSTPESNAVVWGHSQGGGAAAFTAELQPTYAPEIPLVGAIAGAPPADVATSSLGAISPSYRGFVPMIVAGLRAGYPALAADDEALGADGRQALADVSGTCVGEALAAFNGRDVAALFAGLPVDQPQWRDALAANRAGDRPTDVPIFIYHGADDDLVPAGHERQPLRPLLRRRGQRVPHGVPGHRPRVRAHRGVRRHRRVHARPVERPTGGQRLQLTRVDQGPVRASRWGLRPRRPDRRWSVWSWPPASAAGWAAEAAASVPASRAGAWWSWWWSSSRSSSCSSGRAC